MLFKLPSQEKYDLRNQLQRSSKAIPRLIAEGYAKKHQRKGFQKYLDDAMAESNETEVGLCQCLDIHFEYLDRDLVKWLAMLYDRISKQIFKLKEGWNQYHLKRSPN